MQEQKTKELHDIAKEVGYDVERSGLTFEKFVTALFRAYDKGYEAGSRDGVIDFQQELYGEYVKMRATDES